MRSYKSRSVKNRAIINFIIVDFIAIASGSKTSRQMLSLLLEDKVDYGVGLSYLPTSLYCLTTGQSYNPMT